MAKALSKFFTKWATPKLLADRLCGRTVSAGARLLPVNKKDDEAAQLRIDAGETIDGKVNLTVQVNSKATSKSLKQYVAENGRGTHGKLATATFDTKAEDPDAEAERVVDELEKKAREKVG